MENGKIVRAKATTEALREREEKRLKKELEKRAADTAAEQVRRAADLTASPAQHATVEDASRGFGVGRLRRARAAPVHLREPPD